jgi:pyruvate dehydrogenase phosphatase
MRKLHSYLDEELKKAGNSDAAIQNAIKAAYNKVEADWVSLAKDAFDKGFPKVAYVGSCALVAVVKDNKLYVANAGDSKAALLRKKPDGTLEYIKASKTFNANKAYEQERLK